MHVTTISGIPACPLALAAHPNQDPRCIQRAFEAGINFFFFYSPGQTSFVHGLKSLLAGRREETIIASGSGSRTAGGLRSARRKILAAIGTDSIDVFFAEYVNPGDDMEMIFGDRGVLEELQQWKRKGWIRFVGGTAHDRMLAKRLAEDARVDVLMHRYNMAHRKAAAEVFPAALEQGTPVVAFTATRWGTLLQRYPQWPGEPPTAAECYHYCLAHPAVSVVLTSPKSVAELNENLAVLSLPPMNRQVCDFWSQFGDVVYEHGRETAHDFESQWP